jgi:hypothetical protein
MSVVLVLFLMWVAPGVLLAPVFAWLILTRPESRHQIEIARLPELIDRPVHHSPAAAEALELDQPDRTLSPGRSAIRRQSSMAIPKRASKPSVAA